MTRDMTQGSPWKLILQFSIPTALGLVFQQLYSMADTVIVGRTLGVDAPVRESGDVAGSGACKLVGPCGEVEIAEGVIAAKRHIHITPADAEEFGVSDKEIVSVKIESEGRKLTFGDVVVRVSDSYAKAMHIDTDESNAACAFGECYGEIVK